MDEHLPLDGEQRLHGLSWALQLDRTMKNNEDIIDLELDMDRTIVEHL